MKINEIFGITLQGEGKFAGVPSIFIRTNHCNLRCGFTDDYGNRTLCDTPYTSWTPEDKKDMNVDEISNSIKDILYACPTKTDNKIHIIISGGEPMMVEHDILLLCARLKYDYDCVITIETNGTYRYQELDKIVDLYSISPKLSSSIPVNTKYEQLHTKNRINDSAFQSYSKFTALNEDKIQWKFVVCKEKDIDEILEFKDTYKIPNANIYLMPMGITNEQLQTFRNLCWNACIKHLFNYTDRLHVINFGVKRGI